VTGQSTKSFVQHPTKDATLARSSKPLHKLFANLRRRLRRLRIILFTPRRLLAAIISITVVVWGAREPIVSAIQTSRSVPWLSKIYAPIVDKISPIRFAPNTTLSVAILHDGALPDVVHALRMHFPTSRISFFELEDDRFYSL
jgi:hypothetical protein